MRKAKRQRRTHPRFLRLLEDSAIRFNRIRREKLEKDFALFRAGRAIDRVARALFGLRRAH